MQSDQVLPRRSLSARHGQGSDALIKVRRPSPWTASGTGSWERMRSDLRAPRNRPFANTGMTAVQYRVTQTQAFRCTSLLRTHAFHSSREDTVRRYYWCLIGGERREKQRVSRLPQTASGVVRKAIVSQVSAVVSAKWSRERRALRAEMRQGLAQTSTARALRRAPKRER